MSARDRLAAIAACAANMDPFITTAAGGGSLRRYDADSIRAVANDVPALVAFATAVLDLADRALGVRLSEAQPGDAAAAAFGTGIRLLADEHLGGTS